MQRTAPPQTFLFLNKLPVDVLWLIRDELDVVDEAILGLTCNSLWTMFGRSAAQEIKERSVKTKVSYLTLIDHWYGDCILCTICARFHTLKPDDQGREYTCKEREFTSSHKEFEQELTDMVWLVHRSARLGYKCGRDISHLLDTFDSFDGAVSSDFWIQGHHSTFNLQQRQIKIVDSRLLVKVTTSFIVQPDELERANKDTCADFVRQHGPMCFDEDACVDRYCGISLHNDDICNRWLPSDCERFPCWPDSLYTDVLNVARAGFDDVQLHQVVATLPMHRSAYGPVEIQISVGSGDSLSKEERQALINSSLMPAKWDDMRILRLERWMDLGPGNARVSPELERLIAMYAFFVDMDEDESFLSPFKHVVKDIKGLFEQAETA